MADENQTIKRNQTVSLPLLPARCAQPPVLSARLNLGTYITHKAHLGNPPAAAGSN